MKKIYFFLMSLFAFTIVNANCSLYPVTLSNRVSNSSVIIEGRVISKQSFWNVNNNYIFTSNLISVTQVLKGVVNTSFIEIITDGGIVGTSKQVVDPTLELEVNQSGIFMIDGFNQTSQFGFPVFNAYADQQGFIKFEEDGTANDPFTKYNSINGDLKTLLQNQLNIIIPPFNDPSPTPVGGGKFGGSQNINMMPITSISPATITAGTASQLTITGTGFGASQGTNNVQFKNADNGGASNIQPHATQYISWTNTQIVVQVPARTSGSGQAGTGAVTVNIAGVPNVSTQTLIVSYGHLNVLFASTLTPQIFNTRHHSTNGSGGMTWRMFTAFDASVAPKADFLLALGKWRCATFINWVVGATTTVNTIAQDGVNVCRFDIGAELPVGVLGRCSSYYSGCFAGPTMNWHVVELDIVFDDAPPGGGWAYGVPLGGTQYDFESVAVHELGHGHQLGHVINPLDVMHYSVSNGVNNSTLNIDDINGGLAVMVRNLSGPVCGNTIMTSLNGTNCALAPTASFNVTSPVCVGQNVPLNDLSTNTPTAWAWTMTGGTPGASTSSNTATSYSVAGIFTISLVATNASGASAPLSKTIQVVANPAVTASNATICSGASTILTAGGATSYTWNPGGLTGATQTLSPPTTTVYTIIGSNGTCTSSISRTVNVNASPTVSAVNGTICSGGSTLITASGATSYTWNPGGLTGAAQTLSPPTTTVYTIIGSNGSCTASTNNTVFVNSTPTVSAVNGTICSGNSTIITASGATSFTWNPGGLTGATQTLSPPTTTVYTIIGANGSCTSSITRTVSVNPTPTISASNASICAGNSTVLTASGATSFTWNPGGLTGATQTLSPPTTTVYTIIGASGTCTSSITRTVTVNTIPTLTASNGTICSGNSTVLTAGGATSYTWNPGGLSGATQTLSPPTTTVYTIIGSNGTCSSSISRTVTVNPTPTLSAANGTICSGASTLITASGATSFTWNPGGLIGAAQTLSPPTTTVYTIIGASGSCTSSISRTVTVNPTPTLSAANGTICSGASTLITASGATSFTWNPGGLIGAAQTLSPPTTTVYTIIGANGSCTSSISRTVTVNPTPTISASNATICSGNSTVITASGATSFTWNPGGLTGATQTLSPPTTTVYTIIGASGSCTSSISRTVSVNATPTISASNANICVGGSTVLTASGAGSFTWNPGGLTGATQTLSPPTTTVYTIIGASGSCTSSITRTVTVNGTPTVVVSNATICSGTSTVLTASGAVSFTWNPGGLSGATQTLSPPTTTVYTIIGSNGTCSSNITATVFVNPTPTLSASNGTICSGNSTLITASGATSFTWNPGGLIGAAQTLSPPTTTVYTIIGASGSCTSSINRTVTVNPTPTITASNATICVGNSTIITASGASSFTWNPGGLTGATQTLSPPTTTVYTIVGASGSCTSSITRTVTVSGTPTLSINNATICSGNSTVLTASGAASFTWNPGGLTGATQTLSPPTTTVYTIIGANGSCSASINSTVSVNVSPTVSASSATICSGNSTIITANGASSYTWNPGGLTGATQTLSPGTTTVYSIIGSNGTCTSNGSSTINVNATPTISISNATICPGTSTVLTASGAGSYTWNPGALTGATQTLNPGATQVYTINGISGNCSSNQSATVVVSNTLNVGVSLSSNTICVGDQATLTASGANNYTINPGAIVINPAVINPTTTTTYTIDGATGGCTGNSVVTLTVINCSTGLANLNSENEFIVYPNPTQGIINISFGELFTGKIEVVNTLGQIIVLENVLTKQSAQLSLSQFAKGIYIVKISSHKNANGYIKVIRD